MSFSGAIGYDFSIANAVSEIEQNLNAWLATAPGKLGDLVIGLEAPVSERDSVERELAWLLEELKSRQELSAVTMTAGILEPGGNLKRQATR